jgi:hypothetical protein
LSVRFPKPEHLVFTVKRWSIFEFCCSCPSGRIQGFYGVVIGEQILRGIFQRKYSLLAWVLGIITIRGLRYSSDMKKHFNISNSGSVVVLVNLLGLVGFLWCLDTLLTTPLVELIFKYVQQISLVSVLTQ